MEQVTHETAHPIRALPKPSKSSAMNARDFVEANSHGSGRSSDWGDSIHVPCVEEMVEQTRLAMQKRAARQEKETLTSTSSSSSSSSLSVASSAASSSSSSSSKLPRSCGIPISEFLEASKCKRESADDESQSTVLTAKKEEQQKRVVLSQLRNLAGSLNAASYESLKAEVSSLFQDIDSSAAVHSRVPSSSSSSSASPVVPFSTSSHEPQQQEADAPAEYNLGESAVADY